MKIPFDKNIGLTGFAFCFGNAIGLRLEFLNNTNFAITLRTVISPDILTRLSPRWYPEAYERLLRHQGSQCGLPSSYREWYELVSQVLGGFEGLHHNRSYVDFFHVHLLAHIYYFNSKSL